MMTFLHESFKSSPKFESHLVGIDIGGTHVAVIVGQVGPDGKPCIIGLSEIPCYQFCNGAIRNMKELESALRQAVEEAEAIAGCEKITRAYVSVGGPDIFPKTSLGKLNFSHPQHEITAADIENIVSLAKDIQIPRDCEILHCVIQEFLIDGHGAVADPAHQIGQSLEAQVHLIMAKNVHTMNLRRLCKEVGISPEKLVFGPMAAAEVLLTREDEVRGVAIVDLGYDSTDWVMYYQGLILASGSIPIGQRHITSDIAFGLRCPQEMAETIKKKYGQACLTECDPAVRFMMPAAGNKEQEVSQYILSCIIAPRVEEIFEELKNAWTPLRYKEKLALGVRMYGGGSELPGLCEVAQGVLDLDVESAKMRAGACGNVDNIDNPLHYTMIGLIRHAASLDEEKKKVVVPSFRLAMRETIRKILDVF